MKFSEVHDAKLAQKGKASPETIAQRKRARAARQKLRRAKLEAFWASVELTEEDRALRDAIRVPEDWAGRVALIQSLRYAGDRKRKLAEIATIVSLGLSTTKNYLWDPTGEKFNAPSTGNPTGRPPKEMPFEKQLAPPEKPLHEELRRRRGRRLTQVKLAEALGVPVEVVRAWESGEDRPTPAQYAQIMQVLP